MNEPDVASLRFRREGVNRGRWWGEGGVPASLPTRRFHLVGVGLPKTGTTSLAHLFQPFRWGDEFLFAESVERLIAWRAGRLDRDGMRRWLALRAEAGALELDSASFNHYFLDILVELHPTARFVYTRREAVSWADSFLNMVLRHGTVPQGLPLARMAGRARQAHGSQLRSRPVHLPRTSPPRASAARGGTAWVLRARDGSNRGRASTRKVAGDPHRWPFYEPRYHRGVRRVAEVGLERGGITREPRPGQDPARVRAAGSTRSPGAERVGGGLTVAQRCKLAGLHRAIRGGPCPDEDSVRYWPGT